MAASLPRRVRDLVVRLLRHPRTTAEMFADTHERIAATGQRIEARIDALLEGMAELTALTDEMRAELTTERKRSRDVAHIESLTTRALLAHLAAEVPDDPREGPVVSIILPVRDRPAPLRRAVRSVLTQTYPHWQLVVVDDGSDVPASTSLADLVEGDDRVVLTTTPRVGAAGARNHGVGHATGELVTFIDSDNWWFPRRLANVVGAWTPDLVWAIDQQLVLPVEELRSPLRDLDRPLSDLAEASFVDLGCVTVRREVLASLGGPEPFDPTLPRLSDWDFVERLSHLDEPARIPLVGHAYDGRSTDRITNTTPFGPSFHQIRRRTVGRPGHGLRILASEWHFPHLTETYIQSDLVGLRAVGAEVEVWSDQDVSVPYEPGLPWRRGALEDHIRDFRPHLVLSHWLHVGRDHRRVTAELGVPHAVRCHGFDHDEGVLEELFADRGVVVHLFPHLVGRFADRPNLSVDPVAFDVDRVAPTSSKDRRLVLRMAAGLLTKDLDTFLLTAKRCPEHRFVLALGHTYKVEERTEILIDRAREMGSPVEVLTDVPYEKAASLTMDAGIYMHTHGTDHPLGMPISPIEAMATGALVLARALPGSDYVADGGLRYSGDTPEARADSAAALINATLAWDEARWARQATAALDVAWVRHPADLVADRLLEVWREKLGVGRGG